MKIRLLIFSVLLLTLFANTPAQLVYGLKDCVGIGLERNFSILIARNSQTISDNNYTPGNAGYLPSLTLGSAYDANVNNTTRNFKDGTKDATSGAVSTSANASATLALTIFNGFNVRTTYKKLNELKQLGELNTQLTIENYVASVVSTYFDYIQQLQLANNLSYAVSLSRERLRIDEERYLLGSNSKLQVLQSRVYLNADSSNLSRQSDVLRATQIRLNELMAVDDMGKQFSPKDSAIAILPDLIYEKLLNETLISNTSLMIAARNKIISQYDYKLIVSQSYPFLDFSSGYSYSVGTNSTESYRNQLTNGFNSGLTLGVNLFNGFNTRRQIKNSVLDIKSKELIYSQVEQGVRADLLTIFSAYSNNLRLIKLEEQNLETATENLSIALERYKLGNLSGIDLREVQKSLLDARESLLSVQFQAKLAEISLLQISGKIMNYY